MGLNIFQIFGLMGSVINDILAVGSVIGASLMLLFPSKARQFINLGVVGWLSAVFFEVCLRLTGETPEQIGFLIRMSPTLVEVLLLVTAILLGLYLTLKRHSSSYN